MSLRRKPPAKPTIFRVPPNMRCGDQGAYEPKLVSIGPYHRGKSEDLKAMEELKWRLLHHYLSRVPNGSKNEGLRKMKDLEEAARDCYSEVIDMDSDQFVEMLLLDGCFLVQLLINLADCEALQATELGSPPLNRMWCQGLISRDLLLLENQLPYFIVEHLLDTLEMPRWNCSRLQQVAILFFIDLPPQYSNVPEPELRDEVLQVDHLLHLFHKWILSVRELEKASNTRCCSKLLSCSVLSLMINASGNCLSKLLPCSNSSERLPPSTVPTTTELAEAGVKIRKAEEAAFTVPTTTELAEAGVKIEKAEAEKTKAHSFLNVSFC
ncbi:putative UPF0481 protein [Cocos nucifera]|uniref:Putative UPF0481 protein n=1 Tax=Cocos nucifera TaxID=13894 RepID=A0A8K0I1J4_COCNU|nr:putative UPF0481 protein [Cocos nucifera]